MTTEQSCSLISSDVLRLFPWDKVVFFTVYNDFLFPLCMWTNNQFKNMTLCIQPKACFRRKCNLLFTVSKVIFLCKTIETQSNSICDRPALQTMKSKTPNFTRFRDEIKLILTWWNTCLLKHFSRLIFLSHFV